MGRGEKQKAGSDRKAKTCGKPVLQELRARHCFHSPVMLILMARKRGVQAVLSLWYLWLYL